MSDRARIREMRSRLPGGLLAVALLVLLSLLAYQLWLSYQDKLGSAETGTRNLAAIFETRLDATLRRTDADLQKLAASIPVAALNQNAVAQYAREVNAELDSRLFNVEEMAGYRVHDANGDTLYSSDSAHTQRVNISDRDYFRLLRKNPNAGLIFSDVVTGRSTGRQVLVIVRGLRDAQGNFMGIVHGMLELEYYRKQFKSLDLGRQGFISLRRSDTHAQVIRFPDRPSEINTPLAPAHPLVQAVLPGARNLTLHYAVPPENIPRIVGIQALQDFPYYFAVGFGREDILSGWHVQVIVVVMSTLLLFGLIGALMIRLGRMRAREAGILSTLEQSEMHFSELAHLVPVGICHFDEQARYTFVNSRYTVLTGRPGNEVLGLTWTTFVHPEDRKRLEEIWARSGLQGRPVVCECRFVRPDGQITHVIGDVRAETDSAGKVTGYIAALTDITQRKRAEAELLVAKQQAESANLAKTRFLAAASHDLRQPIQAINLFRDALGRTDLSDEQQTISNFLSMSVHSLGDLLYSLLDISKLDAGLVKPQCEPITVETLFKAIDAEFSPQARQKNLRFKLFYPLKDIVLLTDPSLLLSILRNLVDNALKYTESGGILVGARQRGRAIVIQIWDTGIGIDRQHFGDQIFDECFQVGNPVRDRTKGLGIGLSIARRTALLLNGEVAYASRPGRGSMFEIVLFDALQDAQMPGAEPDHSPADVPPEDESSSLLQGWRVVVVEDDPVVAKSIEISLQTLGVKVEVHFSAELALAAPETVGADFYISDYNLPGANGIEFLDLLQQRSAEAIDALLMTGETASERMELIMPSRWTVLFKPVGLSRLLALMNEVAEKRMEQRAQGRS